VEITLTEASVAETSRSLETSWFSVACDFWVNFERRLGVVAFLGELVVLNWRFVCRGGVFSGSLDRDASTERDLTLSPDLLAADTGLSGLSTSIFFTLRSDWFTV
jgi:hypothetical protein